MPSPAGWPASPCPPTPTRRQAGPQVRLCRIPWVAAAHPICLARLQEACLEALTRHRQRGHRRDAIGLEQRLGLELVEHLAAVGQRGFHAVPALAGQPDADAAAIVRIIGFAIQANIANIFSGIILKPWSDRKRSALEIEQSLQGPAAGIPGMNVVITTPDPLPSGGSMPIEFVIRSTADHKEMLEYAQQLALYANTEANAGGGAPTFYFADTDLKFDVPQVEIEIDKESPALLRNLHELRVESTRNAAKTSRDRLQEIYNDAVYYRDKLRSEFNYGKVNLRERAHGEELYWDILTWVASMKESCDHDGSQMDRLDTIMTDFYYGNFSVFQSLPDLWAIDQIFPVMPIHRLKEKPTRNAVLSDITCDSDGKIDKFAHSHGINSTLPLHDPQIEKGHEYMLGIFLVGAYQETLGDLHNLLGDTNVVSVRVENGKVKYSRELEGDSVAEVLTYVEYDPKDMLTRFRNLAESAVVSKRITATERREIMESFEAGLRGYTYFES